MSITTQEVYTVDIPHKLAYALVLCSSNVVCEKITERACEHINGPREENCSTYFNYLCTWWNCDDGRGVLTKLAGKICPKVNLANEFADHMHTAAMNFFKENEEISVEHGVFQQYERTYQDIIYGTLDARQMEDLADCIMVAIEMFPLVFRNERDDLDEVVAQGKKLFNELSDYTSHTFSY